MLKELADNYAKRTVEERIDRYLKDCIMFVEEKCIFAAKRGLYEMRVVTSDLLIPSFPEKIIKHFESKGIKCSINLDEIILNWSEQMESEAKE
jgi:hypothetical protein